MAKWFLLDEILKMTRISSAFYRFTQFLLYSSVRTVEFPKLLKLGRSIENPVNIAALGGSVKKPLRRLMICFNWAEGPEGIMLARVLRWIAQRCPYVEISMAIKEKWCWDQPMLSFEYDSFPKIKYLLLNCTNKTYFGVHTVVDAMAALFGSGPPPQVHFNPDRIPQSTYSVLPCRRSEMQDFEKNHLCRAATWYWRGLLGEASFPDLKVLIISHQPLREEDKINRLQQLREPIALGPEDLKGMQKLVFFNAEFSPELNDSVLTAMLPWMGNLKKLRLIKIPGLTYGGISKLLHRVLPNLRSFHLEIEEENESAFSSYKAFASRKRSHQHPHLCPLLRRFCKNITEANIVLPCMCRDIILLGPRSNVAPTLMQPVDGTFLTISQLSKAFDQWAPRPYTPPRIEERWTRAYSATVKMCREEDCLECLGVYAATNYQNTMWILGCFGSGY
ncbi:hypothetical protein FN846DRAFT_888982 [Sphaerosporella brunnea]|uniref:Uncharacterized protein n=1 Tax=Sphaerosporella brunnea TaxID=1250544 RepID=A0A5J5F0T1_9PEZI|nr:hypothetical protein FN846DRAFT_888982 [Sphaerosporella brunnea]